MGETNVSASEADAAFENRVSIIRILVQERLQRKCAADILLEAESVSPLGRDSNNFVNLVQLEKTDLDHGLHVQYGTHKLDPSVTKIVVRISNPNAMLDEEVRVENEVAAITLMHRALVSLTYSPVPKVFAWETSSSTGPGWIVEEFMKGEKLIAELLKLIQTFDPEVGGFGGLGFEIGRVIVRRSPLWSVGPFPTYADTYQGIFNRQLELVAATPLLDEWNEGGLSERLRNFNESGGLESLLQPSEPMRLTLKILIDPETHRITGLLDFDFSHIASQADEFFYSFMEFSGLVPGPFEGGDLERLRDYQIHGFPDLAAFEEVEDTMVDWNMARLWHVAQRKHGVNGPADIGRISELADIYWFLLGVCPPFFSMPKWLAKRTEEQKQATKAAIGKSLGKYLDKWGY
ncbi:hypothetical protein E4T44_00230 [Aureobasidium sp. EXF-8845]|nr:hypothetical protein E4T44_00230 [Aureobasidium sp. EXF-8845]KAI4858224.1 hypothetical protein E4T45_00263 [Aureobasidium sp. EXF-8846]